MDSPWTATLRELEGVLARQGVEWAVFGAIAANLYRAEPRTTYDVDILLSLGRGDMEGIADAARTTVSVEGKSNISVLIWDTRPYILLLNYLSTPRRR